MSNRNPMPNARVVVVCEECGKEIADFPILTNRLAAEIFRVRKEHAKQTHGWQEDAR